jgi:hypothetical protein
MLNLRCSASLLVLGATLSSGCELADILGKTDNPRTLVNVSTTHHATAAEGVFPDKGGDGEIREFDTDMGWSITLVRAYFTTADVTLVDCDGESTALDMYHGPLAEDVTARDLEMLTVGGALVKSAEFCAMQVHYGPYPQTSSTNGLDPRITGATFYLEGAAVRGDVVVPFEIRSDAPVDAELDLSSIDAGRPLTVDGSEDFPVELALSKTYDRLFDSVDFETATAEDLVLQVGAALALESRVGLDRVAAQ